MLVRGGRRDNSPANGRSGVVSVPGELYPTAGTQIGSLSTVVPTTGPSGRDPMGEANDGTGADYCPTASGYKS